MTLQVRELHAFELSFVYPTPPSLVQPHDHGRNILLLTLNGTLHLNRLPIQIIRCMTYVHSYALTEVGLELSYHLVTYDRAACCFPCLDAIVTPLGHQIQYWIVVLHFWLITGPAYTLTRHYGRHSGNQYYNMLSSALDSNI